MRKQRRMQRKRAGAPTKKTFVFIQCSNKKIWLSYRKSYLKKVAFTPVSCQLLDAGWKQFGMLGKSAKHHKAHQIKRYVFICWCIYYALLTLILSTLLDINKVTEMSYRLKVSSIVTSILIEGASQNIGVPYRYLLEENKNKYNAFLLVNISTAIFLVLSWKCVSLTSEYSIVKYLK